METNVTSSFSGFQFTTSRISIIHSQVAAGSYKSPFSGIFMFFFCAYMPSSSISSLWLRSIDGGGCAMQMFGMAEKEMEYRVELFNRWVMSLLAAVLPPVHHLGGACEIRSLVRSDRWLMQWIVVIAGKFGAEERRRGGTSLWSGRWNFRTRYVASPSPSLSFSAYKCR